jgi:hypothetical protein
MFDYLFLSALTAALVFSTYIASAINTETSQVFAIIILFVVLVINQFALKNTISKAIACISQFTLFCLAWW